MLLNTPKISAHQGALVLIDMLYKQGHINKKTYENIQNKYNKVNKGLEREVNVVYNTDNNIGLKEGDSLCQQA